MWWWKYSIFLLVVLLVGYFWYVDVYQKHSFPSSQKFNQDQKFKSVGEELCARIMSEHYKRDMKINIRPSFLRNPKTGKCLELDVYDQISKTAVEYNGAQHYKYPNTFHKTEEEFNDQVYRDKLKKKLCKKENVSLIVVPYSVDDGFSDKEIRYKLLKSFILERLTRTK